MANSLTDHLEKCGVPTHVIAANCGDCDECLIGYQGCAVKRWREEQERAQWAKEALEQKARNKVLNAAVGLCAVLDAQFGVEHTPHETRLLEAWREWKKQAAS